MLKSFLKPPYFFLKFRFSNLSKPEKIMKKADRNYSKVQTTSEQIKEDYKEFLSSFEVQKFRPLSEAPTDPNITKFGLKFSEDKTKLNKILRKNYNKAIQTKPGEMAKAFIDEKEDLPFLESRRENLRKIEEMKQFNKIFFKKNEIIRQLRKQELKAENFLPLNSLNNDVFIIDLRKRFLDYKENLKALKNNRIDNFLFHSNENKKLGLLLQSGLLDNEKNISEVIAKSVELLKKEQNSKGLIESNSQNKEISILSEKTPEDFENNKELYFSIIKNLGFNLDSYETQYNFEDLALFFESVIKTDPQTSNKLLENLHLIQKIKGFENYLYEKLVDNALDMRVERRAEFKDLTEKESLNYVKYNIDNVDHLFQMFDNSKEIHTPALISSMVQKVSLLKFKTNHSIIYVINDKRYAALLRALVGSVHMFTHRELVNTVWALGKIHAKERGVINKRIFGVLVPKISNEILQRLNEFSIEEFAFLCRGLVNMPNFDLSKNDDYSKQIYDYIDEKIDKIENLFVLQGINLFLSLNPSERTKNLLQKSFDVLAKKQEMIEALDEKDIMDLCYFYSGFLDGTKQNEMFAEKMRTFFDNINNKILNSVEKFSFDEVGSLFIFLTKMKLLPKELTINLRKKMMDSLKDYERFRDFSLVKISVSLAYYDYFLKDQDFKFQIDNFFENVVINSLFPLFLFKSTSPKNLPYAEIGKIISNFKNKIKEKWLVSSLFSLASVKFTNEDLFENSILFLIQEKKTENLASLTHLAFISEMMQLSLPIRNLVKNSVKKSIENNFNEGKLIDPLISMRIAYILNTFYCFENHDTYLKLLKSITGFFEYFSMENLVLFAWSFGKIEKNEEISKFLEDFNDFLRKTLKNSNLQPQILYLINQYQQLTDMRILDVSIDKKTFQKLYQNQEEIIEKLEFYKGTRFSTKLVKTEIREILAEEGMIKEMDVLTNSLIKVDFILRGEKNDKILVLVHSDEKFGFDLKGERNLKKIYQNEIEILRKKEGENVVVINSKEFLQTGVEAKKIEEEKRLKKVFLKKMLKGL